MDVADERRSILLASASDGGAARVARESVAALSARGWHVRHVMIPNRGSALSAARRVYRRERGNVLSSSVVHVEHGSNDLAVFWFALLAARSRCDVVTVVHDAPKVVHAPGAGIIGGGTRWRDILAYRLLAPIGDAFLRRMYARRVAVALVLSDRARSAWTTDCPRQTMRLPLAGDAPADPPAPSNGAHVLFAGYIAPSKGVDTLLDAWSRVSDTRGLPLVIAGAANGSLGPAYVENLRAGVRASSNTVVWLGALDDEAFERAIADAAIVVVPYRRSNPASGIVSTAMVAGRAIVGTDVPAVADSLTDGLDAMIVPVDDIEALAAALTKLLAEPALRDRLGAAAGARAAREHSWDAHCSALESAYSLATGRQFEADGT